MTAGRALFRLVRFWSRRWAPDVAEKLDDSAPRTSTVQNLYVVEAVHSAAPRGEVTVAEVARQVGLDRSVASRMISDAVRDGYLRRDTSNQDARRARLSLTTEGERFLAASHAHQEQVFEALVAHWPAEDKRRFAGYLQQLAGEVLDS